LNMELLPPEEEGGFCINLLKGKKGGRSSTGEDGGAFLSSHDCPGKKGRTAIGWDENAKNV